MLSLAIWGRTKSLFQVAVGFPLTDTCIFLAWRCRFMPGCQFLAPADSQILAINPQRLELGTQPGQTAGSTLPGNDTRYETQIRLWKRNFEQRAKSLCNSPASCVICKPVKGFASTPNIWATPLYSAIVQLVDTSCSEKYSQVTLGPPKRIGEPTRPCIFPLLYIIHCQQWWVRH